MTDPARRRVVSGAAVVACSLFVTSTAAEATEEVNVRLHSAAFRGTGIVKTPDAKDPAVSVNAGTNQCDAVVVVGAATPAVVPCSFRYEQSFNPTAGSCTGLVGGAGTLTVYLPFGYAHDFVFTRLRVVADEGSAFGFGAEYADPGTGAVRSGYVQFNFVSETCNRSVPNAGIALY